MNTASRQPHRSRAAARSRRQRSGAPKLQVRPLGDQDPDGRHCPRRGPMQMCVDQASDNLMQERAREKVNCPRWMSVAVPAR